MMHSSWHVTVGSKRLIFSGVVMACCSSATDESRPAPYTLNVPSGWRHKPNSTVKKYSCGGEKKAFSSYWVKLCRPLVDKYYRSQFVNIFVRCAQRCQPDFLWELRKTGVGQQRHVPQQLVAAIRFGRIEWIRRMANVLCAVEHAKCQAREEIAWRQISGYRTQLEAGLALQKRTDVLQLRQIVLTVTAVFDELWPVLHIFRHRMHHVQAMQFTEHHAPCSNFLRRVLNTRNGLATGWNARKSE